MPIMDYSELHRKLITAARIQKPSDRVPYTFEKRVMANLAKQPILDQAAVWASALWRGVAPCVAIMLLLGAYTFFAGEGTASTGDVSQDFDSTVLAAVGQDQPVDTTW